MLYECPYCGETKPSENGTGSDVACCGEVGHSVLSARPVWQMSYQPEFCVSQLNALNEALLLLPEIRQQHAYGSQKYNALLAADTAVQVQREWYADYVARQSEPWFDGRAFVSDDTEA